MAEKHSCTYVYGCFLLYHNLFISKIFGIVLTPFTPLFHLFRDKKRASEKISETLKITVLNNNYSIIVATAPEPTVLPPSRIAKRRPCSIATLWISSTVISTLSPGMHISVPAGSSQTPVTSVVLK